MVFFICIYKLIQNEKNLVVRNTKLLFQGLPHWISCMSSPSHLYQTALSEDHILTDILGFCWLYKIPQADFTPVKNFIFFFLTTKFLFGQWCPSEKGWNYISYNITSSTPVLKYIMYHLLYSTIIYHFSNFNVWNLCFYEMMERFPKHSIIDLNVKNNCAYM